MQKTALTRRVILGILIGIFIGYTFPNFGIELKILGDVFLKLVKMLLAPIVFFTVVLGIAGMNDMKKAGRIGAKALIYFEIVTTFALAIGLVVVQIIQPGKGFDISHVPHDTTPPLPNHSFWESLIPDNAVGAFTKGDMLPLLFFAVLFGVALGKLGEKTSGLLHTFQMINDVFFKMVGFVMLLSPLAAGGAMAYTIGKFGLGSLFSLGKLMLCVYLTMFLFIALFLGFIAKLYKFNIWRLLAYLKEEILLVLGTSSSESALPSLMQKLEKFGCSKPVVGLVVPTGYSFNLDGTAIYLSMAALFIAQAYGVSLSTTQILTLFGVLMLTSKGAAGITGSGYVTLAATLTALPGNFIPLEGMALLLGVDRFMSEARSITNLIGNSVATVVIAKHEKEFN